jgi:PAS domain S-box-containing protein
LGLQTKFILCVALILVAVMTTGGVYFYQHQEAEFFDRVSRDMELTASFVESTRSYVRDVARPGVAAATDRYVPEAQSPNHVSKGIFDRFAATHPGFRYKDASDNPLNPANRADAFEADLLRRLRADRTLTRITGLVGGEAAPGPESGGGPGGGGEWLLTARPVVAEHSCLKCHGSPDAAPAEIVTRYGRAGGYGWKDGDVVAVLTVRVPTGDTRAAQAAMARRVATWFGSVTVATLVVVFLSGQVLVRIPVRRMARHMADVAGGGHYDRHLPEHRRRDELGTAARAFNGVLDVVSRTLADLRASNETLERRVAERTAEIRRGHRHLELLREASLDGIVSMDAEGRVTDFNPAAEKAFGHRRADAVGKPLADLMIPSQMRDAHRHGLAKYLATGKGPIIGKRLEMSAMRAGGAEFPVELTITAVHLDDKSPPIFTAYVRDLTDRRAGEAALRLAFDSLRESEERYRVLAEALPHFVWTANSDGGTEYINGKWAEYSGMPSAQTLAGRWAAALHPEDLARSVARWEAARAAGRGYEIEYRLRRADGAFRWHLTRVCPVKVTGAGGQNLTKWVGVTTDIHDRREVEASLRRRTTELRAVLDSFPDLLFRLGPDGTMLDYRCGSELELYLPPEEFLGRRAQDVLPPDVGRRVGEAVERVKATRAPVHLEYALPMPSGVEHYEARLLPLGDEEEAVRGQILVVARNVTEQKKAEEARTTLAAVVENSPDAIYAESLDGLITNWNAGAEALYGYRADEAVGRPGSMLVPPGRIEEAGRVRERVKAGERVAPYETVCLAKGGLLLHVSASVSPVRDAQGRVVGAARIVRDITDRRRAQGLERERTSLRDAVSAMEQVLGVVGHELRTPLAGLRAMSEYLLTDAARATDEYEQFLSGIHDEVVRMSDTVNDLLEAARLNSGRARWNWASVSVAEACRDAVDSIRPLVDASRVRLSLAVRPEAATMAGDADGVRRLVLNLLNNARKHTDAGAIDVTAECFERGGKGYVRLCVRDTGSGIRPEIASRLGEAFLLNSGVVGDHYCGGTGLGLAICKGIAAAHGGELLVESVPDQGTSITAEMRTDLKGPAESGGRIVLASPGVLLAEASVGADAEFPDAGVAEAGFPDAGPAGAADAAVAKQGHEVEGISP